MCIVKRYRRKPAPTRGALLNLPSQHLISTSPSFEQEVPRRLVPAPSSSPVTHLDLETETAQSQKHAQRPPKRPPTTLDTSRSHHPESRPFPVAAAAAAASRGRIHVNLVPRLSQAPSVANTTKKSRKWIGWSGAHRRADGGQVTPPRYHPAAASFMETVIQDHTPLADYLKGQSPLLGFASHRKFLPEFSVARWRHLTPLLMADEGEAHQPWATPSVSDSGHDESPPSSPSFAPVGRPMVRKRFRSTLPNEPSSDVPQVNRLSSLRHSYSVRIPLVRRLGMWKPKTNRLIHRLAESRRIEDRPRREPQVHRAIPIHDRRVAVVEWAFHCRATRLPEPIETRTRNSSCCGSNLHRTVGDSHCRACRRICGQMGLFWEICALDKEARGILGRRPGCSRFGVACLYPTTVAPVSKKPGPDRGVNIRLQVARLRLCFKRDLVAYPGGRACFSGLPNVSRPVAPRYFPHELTQITEAPPCLPSAASRTGPKHVVVAGCGRR